MTAQEAQKKKKQKKKIELEQRALQVSMWGGIFFVVLELIVAVFSHSQAVLMDTAFDGAELITTVVSLQIVPLLYKPLTEKRPFGYSPVETWFIVIKGFMLVAITVGLVANNIQIMLEGGRHVSFNMVACFELFAAAVGILVTLLLKKWNNRCQSPLVDAEINSWQIDAIASGGMGLAFLLPMATAGTAFDQISPYLDQIVAIFLTIFILPRPVKMILTGIRELLLLAPEESVMERIKEISQEVMKKEHFQDQFSEASYDVVRMGRRLWVSIYMTTKSDIVSIRKWSEIQQEIEDALIEEFGDVYLELLPEID